MALMGIVGTREWTGEHLQIESVKFVGVVYEGRRVTPRW
jgi:hypothetical protein